MKAAVLVIVLFTSGWGSHQSESEFASLDQCLKALDKVKITIPNGAENEGAGVAYCKLKK